MTNYTAQPETAAHKVLSHLHKHPLDELDAADIALKFGTKGHEVDALLAGAVTAGLLTRRAAKRAGLPVYLAGPNLPKWQPAGGPNATPTALWPATPPKPPKAKREPAPVIDVGSVTVESGLPLPEVRRKRTDWPALFERFTKPGMCSSPLPRAVKTTLQSQANQWFRAKGWKYAIRTVSDTHLRIWRTE
jgi:hypothetical protein